MRGLGRSRWGDDRGAVIVLVGILLAGGVLTGMLAIVIDLGRVYVERRVVQNAADASALALAQHCARATTDPSCATQAAAEVAAVQLSNQNSPDGFTKVNEVCGTTPLKACSGSQATWTNCANTVQPPYARVRTSTQSATGDFFLPVIFGGLNQGPKQVNVGACAQARWGSPNSAMVVLPFVLPACPYVPFGTGVVIEDFDPASPNTSCSLPDGTVLNPVTKGFAFADLPGDNKQCTNPVKVSVNDVLPVETSLTQLCGPNISTTLDPYIASGESLIFPVVGGHQQTGQGQYEFTIITFRSFVLKGYKLKSKEGGSPPPGGWDKTVCNKGSQRSCLYGTFIEEVTTGGVGGGPNLGVVAIQLVP